MGDTNWGIFKRHFWGELLRHQHSLGLQLAFVMTGPGIATSLAALVPLRIAKPIRFRIQ